MNSLKAIDALRFPLIVLVVYAHMLSFSSIKIDFPYDVNSLYILISEIISSNLGRLPVPCFFLFSGFFLFLKLEKMNLPNYFKLLKKRGKTLLIPYLFWNLFYVLIIIVKNCFFKKLGFSFDEQYEYISNAKWLNLLWNDPVYFAFWYIRDLMCMILISPFFFYFFRRTRIFGVILLTLLYLLRVDIEIRGFSHTAIFYFGLGSYIGLNRFNIIDISRTYGKYITILSFLLLFLSIFFNGTGQYELFIRLFLIFAVFAVLFAGAQLLNNRNLTEQFIKLAPTTFFIYATHQIYILGWIKGFVQKFSTMNQGLGKIFSYLASPWICVMICLFLYFILKRIFPKILAFSLGGRV